ncbi:MAG: hypothetical protein WD118_08585 [Phycisphaeraceae bacterium]
MLIENKTIARTINALMGSKPEARLRFIQEHAAFAQIASDACAGHRLVVGPQLRQPIDKSRYVRDARCMSVEFIGDLFCKLPYWLLPAHRPGHAVDQVACHGMQAQEARPQPLMPPLANVERVERRYEL